MSKANEKAMTLFAKQKNKKKAEFEESFENPTLKRNPIEAFFGSHKLSDEDEEKIRSLVGMRYQVDGIDKKKISEDITGLIELSSQIRAITKQSIVLHGERIFRGQEILKGYKRGTFTAWLELTYGNRQTPYNFLYYYILYRELPSKTRKLFQKIPYRIAYMLGSRGGSLDDKIQVIEKNHKKSQKELLILIEEIFPLAHSDQRVRASSSLKLTESALENLKLVCSRKGALNSEVIKRLKQISDILDTILSS